MDLIALSSHFRQTKKTLSNQGFEYLSRRILAEMQAVIEDSQAMSFLFIYIIKSIS